jgi:hypothetical protein
MTDSDHRLFIVKANDGVTVRLSAYDRLLTDAGSFEVVIYGLPSGQIANPHLKAGRLIGWSPYTLDYYDVTPDGDEMRQHYEIVRQRIGIRPDIVDDNENVLFAFVTHSGYRVTTLNDHRRSAARAGNQKLSLGMLQAWVVEVFRERRLSPEELGELDRRTNAACERYGWPDLGKQYDAEQTRNIAYLMLNREMPFRAAAFEYLAALEKGFRKLASDAELDSAAASLLNGIAADRDSAAISHADTPMPFVLTHEIENILEMRQHQYGS